MSYKTKATKKIIVPVETPKFAKGHTTSVISKPTHTAAVSTPAPRNEKLHTSISFHHQKGISETQ